LLIISSQYRIKQIGTKLLGEDSVISMAFDLQLNPANPGMQFHKLDNAKDKNFWSVRVSSDLRIIVNLGDEVVKVFRV